MDGVDSENAITDDDGEDEESETEDEFAQFQESQEQPSGRADDDEEDMTPWEGAKCTKDRDEEAEREQDTAMDIGALITIQRTEVTIPNRTRKDQWIQWEQVQSISRQRALVMRNMVRRIVKWQRGK